MNYWNILDIEPTVDIKAIKRAYASKLKLYHPEDDPEGFQRLREAYEAVLKEAKYIKEVKSSNIVKDEKIVLQNENITLKAKLSNTYNNFNENEPANVSENLVDKFMNKVDAIYNDFFKRIDINNWIQLLEDETFWVLDIKKALSFNMLEFLMDNYNLPHDVWLLLNEYFFWTEEENDLYKQFDESFINFIMSQIYSPCSLRYEFFKKDYECNYDEFISLRLTAFNALINNNLEVSEKSLKAAMEIFSDDPDLLRMIGTYYLRVDNLQNSKSTFTHLIEVAPKEIDGYLNRGYIFLKLKEINSAYYDFQQALTLMPDNVSALRGLAKCYFHFNNLLESKILYEQISETCPYDVDSRACILEVNAKLIDEYSEKLTNAPENISILYELAKIYFEMDYFEQCYNTIKRLPKNVDVNSDMYLLLARALYNMKEEEKCLKFFDKALALSYEEGKNGYESLFYRGVFFLELKQDYNAALKDFKAALKINRYDAELLSNLGDAYRCNGDHHKAVEFCDEAIKINPSKWIYYSIRGISHYALKNFKEARDDHGVVVDHRYSFSNAWYRKGYCHLQLGEYEEAANSFKEALDWHTSIKDIHLRLALTHFKLKDLRAALKHIKLYCDDKPKDPFGFILMGDIHRASGDVSRALNDYLTAYELKPDSCKILKLLSYCCSYKQDFKKAFEYYEKILEINKEDEDAYINSIWLCAELNDFINGGTASSDYENFVKKNHDIKLNPYTEFHYGVILYKKGLCRIAIYNLENALELGLKSGDLLSYLSMVYYESGNKKNALKFAKEALDTDPSNEDFKIRYEGILKYQCRKGFLMFKTNPSSQKAWPSTKPLDHYPLNLPTLNISIGENYEEDL
ncbi:tetratricopeptide repeat protein [Clostridium sp. P21]|uniref:Tetratricopeptide repeat protein n=1 Tax=Clostridium muellerianum TaxID=2716538 RepID=A0A7Y0EGY0_9CLOT|nr:J domain-containing protein [Clostridium muellerianum]NMM62937.1 tetratricopeptide repeat protein [Clostridium muellerianum]